MARLVHAALYLTFFCGLAHAVAFIVEQSKCKCVSGQVFLLLPSEVVKLASMFPNNLLMIG